MNGTRSKGALALVAVLVLFLVADLYKAEFGSPQNAPSPITTPFDPGTQPTFTGTQYGVTPPSEGTSGSQTQVLSPPAESQTTP